MEDEVVDSTSGQGTPAAASTPGKREEAKPALNSQALDDHAQCKIIKQGPGDTDTCSKDRRGEHH